VDSLLDKDGCRKITEEKRSGTRRGNGKTRAEMGELRHEGYEEICEDGEWRGELVTGR